MRGALALILAAAPLAAVADPVYLPAAEDYQAVVTPVTAARNNRVFIVEEMISHSAPDGDVVAMFWLWPNQTGWPDIEATGPDRFTARAGCDTCGRTNWRLDYHAARRGGQWVLAGFKQTRADRMSNEVSTCDVNLLTGRVQITRVDPEEGGPNQTNTGTTDLRAIPLSSVTMHYTVPECEALP